MSLPALPFGISSFGNIRLSDRVYVDKTAQIFFIVDKYSRVLLTRPRRFGKSLLVSVLALPQRGPRFSRFEDRKALARAKAI